MGRTDSGKGPYGTVTATRRGATSDVTRRCVVGKHHHPQRKIGPRRPAATRRRPWQSDATPSSVLEHGGVTRPSRSGSVLVVSADPAVRSDWARYVEAQGLRTLRCVGPQVLCVLLDGAHCPLHEEADLAIYDRATVTPELTLNLIRVSHSLPIAFADDRLDAHGHHEPLVTAVAAEGVDEARAGTSGHSMAASFAGVMDEPFLVTELLGRLKHAVETPHAAAPPGVESLAADAVTVSPAAGGRASSEWAPADFFSSAVHELRTPLTSVLGQAQRALRYIEIDPAKARAAIEHTIERAGRMNGLIGELLDHAHISGGALRLESVSFDLGLAIAAAIPQYEHEDLPRITFEVPADPVRVRGDPDRIAQVVGNLLDNALKYSPLGSPITVSLAVVGTEAYLRVEDKGVGIAADERGRIFAPFHRTSRTRDVPGTGLGLDISRRLAEQHRGRLWLEKSTDLGSVFTLALPIVERADQPMSPQGSEDVSETTEAITRHHAELAAHLRARVEAVTSTGSAASAAALVSFLDGELLPHAASEERYLYPVLDPIVAAHGRPTATMSIDHEFITRYRNELAAATERLRAHGDPAAAAEVARLAGALAALVEVHLAKEERAYLPLFAAHLSGREQEAVLRHMHGEPGAG